MQFILSIDDISKRVLIKDFVVTLDKLESLYCDVKLGDFYRELNKLQDKLATYVYNKYGEC